MAMPIIFSLLVFMKYLLANQESERLHFRLLEESDFEAWLPLFDEPTAASFLGMDASLSREELGKLWFKKVFHRYENDLGGMNVLIDKKTNLLVGQCGLLIQQVDGEERLEIGYSILPSYWGQGYATEAAITCKNFAFQANYWDALISIVHIDNIASARVAGKNGMQIEKTIPDFMGMPVNIFRIGKGEWEVGLEG